MTVLVIVALWIYVLGPLSGKNQNKINPASSNPTHQQKNIVSNKPIVFNVYHNKDLAENFYTIEFPKDWQFIKDNKVGNYQLSFNDGNCAVELMDVADNTTLELAVLSQQEPNLKKTIFGYNRLDYKKTTINKNDAHILFYTSIINKINYETEKIYVSGKDKSAVITFSAPQKIFSNSSPIFDPVINSFNWENK